MLHSTNRKLMYFGRSYVVGIPRYVVNRLGYRKGDNFRVVFDDEAETVTYQQVEPESPTATINHKGRELDTVLMP